MMVARIIGLWAMVSLIPHSLFANEECHQAVKAFIDSHLGAHGTEILDEFPQLSEPIREMLIRKIQSMPPGDLSLSFVHPFKNLAWFHHLLTPQNRLQAARAEMFRYLMNPDNLKTLLKNAFTPGQTLSTVEKRALIFLIESRFWYDVEWKFLARFFKDRFKTPFSQYFLSDIMTVRSLFGPGSHKVKEYAKVFDALKNMPSLDEAKNAIDESIAALEKIRTPSWRQEQKIHNLKILRSSLELTSADEVAIADDLKKIVEDQSLHVLRAILFETFPHMARSGVEISGRVVAWLWGLGVLIYIGVETTYYFFPEEYKEQSTEKTPTGKDHDTSKGIAERDIPIDSTLTMPENLLNKALINIGKPRD